MTGRSMLLASALVAVSGVWAGAASAAPIHADMSLQGGGLVEQVQHRGGGGGGRGPGIGGGRSGGGGMSFSRGSGGGMSVGRSGGGNWSGNRAIGGGNFATSNRQSFAATNRPGNWSGNNWNGRRADFRRHRGFRGPAFAFGFGPSYYDYGYDYGYDSGYYPYDDDAYAYVAPGVADGDSVGYCQQRFRSYDPSTGTYLGLDGLRHPCP